MRTQTVVFFALTVAGCGDILPLGEMVRPIRSPKRREVSNRFGHTPPLPESAAVRSLCEIQYPGRGIRSTAVSSGHTGCCEPHQLRGGADAAPPLRNRWFARLTAGGRWIRTGSPTLV